MWVETAAKASLCERCSCPLCVFSAQAGQEKAHLHLMAVGQVTSRAFSGRTNSQGSTEIKPLCFCGQLSFAMRGSWGGSSFLSASPFSQQTAMNAFSLSAQRVYKCFAYIKGVKNLNHRREELFFHFCIEVRLHSD